MLSVIGVFRRARIEEVGAGQAGGSGRQEWEAGVGDRSGRQEWETGVGGRKVEEWEAGGWV